MSSKMMTSSPVQGVQDNIRVALRMRGNPQRRMRDAMIATVSQDSMRLSRATQRYHEEVGRRKVAEAALVSSERHNARLLKASNSQRARMRQLTHSVLVVQEEERREISRELHDVIAQSLAGINVRLENFRRESEANAKGRDQMIVNMQGLVNEAVDTVHRFARELRPAALDDLGLISALHGFAKVIRARSGIHIKIMACAEVEGLDMVKQTVLFRVAQEALANVSRHAKANVVSLVISAISGGFRMEIKDDGKAFRSPDDVMSHRNKHLGIIGMRERMEMVGGSFEIVPSTGTGTTVIVQIPTRKGEWEMARDAEGGK